MAQLVRKYLLAFFSTLLLFSSYYIYINTDKIDDEIIFAQGMLTHHSQAVKIALAINNDEGLKYDIYPFLIDLILTQQSQIGAFNLILDQKNAPKINSMKMPGMVSESDITKLKSLSGEAKLLIGIDLLIYHHLGGVQMSEEFLNKNISDDLKRIAKGIINGQKSEIDYLSNIKKEIVEKSHE